MNGTVISPIIPACLKAFQLAGLGCLCFRIMGGGSGMETFWYKNGIDDFMGVSLNGGTPKTPQNDHF